MSNIVVFIPLLVAFLLFGFFAYKYPLFSVSPLWLENNYTGVEGLDDEYVDCVLEEDTKKEDEYVDCVMDGGSCSGGNSNNSNNSNNSGTDSKLLSILQNISADQGLPALLKVLESQKTTMPTLSSYAPAGQSIQKIGYAQALTQFYKELATTYSMPPDYQEVRKLLGYLDKVIGLSGKENIVETAEEFTSLRTALVDITHYDPGNPGTFLQPVTYHWNAFIVTYLPTNYLDNVSTDTQTIDTQMTETQMTNKWNVARSPSQYS